MRNLLKLAKKKLAQEMLQLEKHKWGQNAAHLWLWLPLGIQYYELLDSPLKVLHFALSVLFHGIMAF